MEENSKEPIDTKSVQNETEPDKIDVESKEVEADKIDVESEETEVATENAEVAEETAKKQNRIIKYFKDKHHKNKEFRAGKSKKYFIIEGIRKLIMVGALCVFTYSSYELTNIYLDYKDGDDTYGNIEDQVLIPVIESGETTTDSAGNTITSNIAEKGFTLNFEALKNLNNSAVGWIRQDNIISYPIIQAQDNTYYLTHNANYETNKNGAIFIDYRVPDGIESRNCIIYGHNMRNGAMFGTLTDYANESYYKDHPTMDIYIGSTMYKYYIFAAYKTEEVGDTYTYNFASDEEFQSYIDLCMSKRAYETDIKEVKVTDKIITLSTCTDSESEKRFIVQMIRGEKVSE